LTKQSSITCMGFPLLQKPTEMCVGRQIKVLGTYWTGSMSNEESNSLYLCTVRDYHELHKWDTGGTPSQSMELQEMGVDGQGIRETGGSASDRIFFMKHPMSSFMKYPIPFLLALGSSIYVETTWYGYPESVRESVHHRGNFVQDIHP
jgi:hypothetical protein